MGYELEHQDWIEESDLQEGFERALSGETANPYSDKARVQIQDAYDVPDPVHVEEECDGLSFK